MTRGRSLNHAYIPDPTGTLNPEQALADIAARTPQQEAALAITHQPGHSVTRQTLEPEGGRSLGRSLGR